MNCPVCDDYTEIIKEGNGDYEIWCDCGYHEIIDIEDVRSIAEIRNHL